MGLRRIPLLHVASVDHVELHDRVRALRPQSIDAPSGKRAAAHVQLGLAVLGPAQNDRRGAGELLRGRRFRFAPLAGRIRGLDSRAQECPQRPVLDADDVDVPQVRRTPRPAAVHNSRADVLPGVDVQADQCAASGLAVADGFWPLRRLKKKAILEKVPLFVIGGIAAVITYISQSRSAAVTLPSDYGL